MSFCADPVTPPPRLTSALFRQEDAYFLKNIPHFSTRILPAQLNPAALSALEKITTCSLPHPSASPLSHDIPEEFGRSVSSVSQDEPTAPRPNHTGPFRDPLRIRLVLMMSLWKYCSTSWAERLLMWPLLTRHKPPSSDLTVKVLHISSDIAGFIKRNYDPPPPKKSLNIDFSLTPSQPRSFSHSL